MPNPTPQRRSRAFAACLLVLSPLSAAAAPPNGSIGFQVNAAHTGNLKTAPSFRPPLKQLWSEDLGGPVSYPIVANNMMFVTASDTQNYGSQIFALNASNGNIVWQKAIAGTYFESYLTYENGVIYDLNYNGVLQAFTAATGASVWSIQIPDQFSFGTPPIADGKSIYVTGAGDGGTIYKIDGATGAVQWTFPTDSGGGTPAIAHATVLVGDGCDTYGLATKSGAPLWHDNGGCSGGVRGLAAIIGQYGFVPAFSGTQYAATLALQTGAPKQTFSNEIAAFDGKLAIQVQTTMTATQYATGNFAWTFAPNDTLIVPPSS
jgi:hypothetical protein